MDTTPKYGFIIPSASDTDLMDSDLWRTPFQQVEDKISALSDTLTVGALTIAANWTLTTGYLKKKSGIVTVGFVLTRTTSILTFNAAGDVPNTALFTVPAGYRPGISAGITPLEGSANILWMGNISAAGAALVTNGQPSTSIAIGDTICGTATYIQES